MEKTWEKNCSIWCGNLGRKLKRCNVRVKLYKIKVRKRFDKIKVTPIIYDDVHIIVINPYDKYQIATVSKVVNDD
jgi:hypothetical protein